MDTLLWILLSPFWLSLVLVSYIVLRFIRITLKYQLKKSKYAHLPKQQGYPILLHFDLFGGFDKLITLFYDNDGNMAPLLHQGPSFDGSHLVAVSDPVLFKEILLTRAAEFPKYPETYDVMLAQELGLGNGLVTAKGEEWKIQRKLITPLFHFAVLKNGIPTVVKNTKLFIKEVIEANPTRRFEVSRLYGSLTGRVIIEFAFGNGFDYNWMSTKYQELLDAVNVYWLAKLIMGDTLVRHLPWPWTTKKQRVLKEIHKKVVEAIEIRRNAPPEQENKVKEHENLIDVLLHAKEPVPHQMILDECLTFLFGGLDTTSRLISWMTYFLGTYPTIQQKLYDEVQTVIGQRDITAEDLPKLQYCKQLMNETLRLRPSIPGFDRWATEDCMLGGHFIPKHTVLALYFINAHLDPKHWDKPLEFNPDRWEKENPDRHHFAFLPFSAGERSCIGQKFGLQEAAVVICSIVQQYKIKIEEKPKIRIVTDPLLSPYDVEVIFTKRT